MFLNTKILSDVQFSGRTEPFYSNNLSPQQWGCAQKLCGLSAGCLLDMTSCLSPAGTTQRAEITSTCTSEMWHNRLPPWAGAAWKTSVCIIRSDLRTEPQNPEMGSSLHKYACLVPHLLLGGQLKFWNCKSTQIQLILVSLYSAALSFTFTVVTRHAFLYPFTS